jgi:DNA-binding transcriptional regulator YdaS (Cro superfamily)
MNRATTGPDLLNERLRRGTTQAALAARLGVTPPRLSHVDSDARLVAITSDPAIVALVVGQMLADQIDRPDHDPVVGAIDRARLQGLRVIRRELREQRP